MKQFYKKREKKHFYALAPQKRQFMQECKGVLIPIFAFVRVNLYIKKSQTWTSTFYMCRRTRHTSTETYSPVLGRKKLQNTSLSKKELSLILGGLLGNGSLKMYTGYKNARYSFRHSSTQTSYFYYKAKALIGISSCKSIQVQKSDNWSSNKKLFFCSRALPCLSEIYSITHSSNSIKVQRRWLNHLSAESLSIWWFDDGSIVSGGRQGCISTDGFTLEENKILVQYLKVVWKIEGSIHPVKKYEKKSRILISKKQNGDFKETNLYPKIYYRIYFSTNNLKKFLTIILPYTFHKDMLYKCTLRYKNSKLQERWISHMKNLLPPILHSFL